MMWLFHKLAKIGVEQYLLAFVDTLDFKKGSVVMPPGPQPLSRIQKQTYKEGKYSYYYAFNEKSYKEFKKYTIGTLVFMVVFIILAVLMG